MTTAQFLAIDLGAESGRGLLGRFDGGRIELDQVHRFPNGPVRVFDHLHWDPLRLVAEIQESIRRCGARSEGDGPLEGIGVDTWGVDMALIGRDRTLLGAPYHYRDRLTEGVMERVFARVPRQAIFEQTGLQFMRFNTLFQLYALAEANSPLLEVAETLLLMPDLMNFLLTGRAVSEFTIATTSQMYDPRRRTWADPLLDALHLPTGILPEIVPAGTVLGPLLPSLAADLGVGPVPVIAPACHDTGSAVAGVPAGAASWAYISSGTWSLMGVEVPEPIVTPAVLQANFTNEGGVGGTIRLLKNVMGLWLVQECRRSWARAGVELSYEAITRMAAEAPPFGPLVEPDAAEFLAPADMPAQLADFCRRTGQSPPADRGAVVRCALESLALKYRWVLEHLEQITGRRIEVIHIMGGGSQNVVLNQLTADACNRPVLAGPVEATALGNIAVQAMGRGRIGSLAEARAIIGRSVDVHRYEPHNPAAWDEAYARWQAVRERAAAVH